ncbi:symmetrical bis(5'-nucleosyl)-tetraphosphatase [Buchnera aphidicola (Neophyllaphis podocarpi)]|uniref:symmetrical bis(5'-nucleosyl)-tetraphosphatase n=1 Tax=Buchnera aphidicola TaxID=9 RepID=UPI0031B85FF0
MSTYIVGDIHGCYKELRLLLNKANFNFKKDYLWITGDLVFKGPDSLKVLKYIYSFKNKVRIVLGNHDINLISMYFNVYNKNNCTNELLYNLLNYSDHKILIDWLRFQPLLQVDHNLKIVMSHAGIFPKWSLIDVQFYANEVEKILRSKYFKYFLKRLWGNFPNKWNINLKGVKRFRFIVNSLTRMRYCFSNFYLDMQYKLFPCNSSSCLKPWFDFDSKIAKTNYIIFFGHWSSLKGNHTPPKVIALDTGCCWGGCLTMVRVEDFTYFYQPKIL